MSKGFVHSESIALRLEIAMRNMLIKLYKLKRNP